MYTESTAQRFCEAGANHILKWHEAYGEKRYVETVPKGKDPENWEETLVRYQSLVHDYTELPLDDPENQRKIAYEQTSRAFDWAKYEPVTAGFRASLSEYGLEGVDESIEHLGELADWILHYVERAAEEQASEEDLLDDPEQDSLDEGQLLDNLKLADACSESAARSLSFALDLRRRIWISKVGGESRDVVKADSKCLMAGLLLMAAPEFHVRSARFLARQLALNLDVAGTEDERMLALIQRFIPEDVDLEHEPDGFELTDPSSLTESDFDVDARAILSAADRLRETVSIGEDFVHMRHLLGAVLVSEDAAEVHAILEDLGVERAALAYNFVRFLEHETEADDRFDAWRTFLAQEGLQESRETLLLRTTLSADTVDAQGPDLLGIDGDAAALASLIAARDAKPPLSIGLFGDWGSGKSFFMGRMRKHVDRLSEKARQSKKLQKDCIFYKRVVQVEFNAWHYAEGNLWASLVEHIFSNLRTRRDDPEDVLRERQRQYLEKLNIKKEALEKAQEQETQAKERLKQANEDLSTVEKNLSEKEGEVVALTLKDVFEGLQLDEALSKEAKEALEEINKSEIGSAAKDLHASLQESRGLIERSSRLITPLLKAPDRGRRFAWLLFSLLAGPAAGIAAALVAHASGLIDLKGILASGAGLAATATAGATWIRNQNQWVSGWLDKAESAQSKIEAKAEAAQKVRDEALAKVQQRVDKLKTEFSEAKQEVANAEQEVREAHNRLAEETGGRMLARFIAERASSKDYREHLGLVALIRRDFEELSQLQELANKDLMQMTDLEVENRDADHRINRIVLYIDDLDRCPPQKVVEVLQAVHLLLAFPLFVVVVGVDSRWISRSLRHHYKEMFQHLEGEGEMLGRGASPHDYLEKIFQIPLWLQPMGEDGVKSMVAGLLKGSVVKWQKKEATPSTTFDGRSESATESVAHVEFEAPDEEPHMEDLPAETAVHEEPVQGEPRIEEGQEVSDQPAGDPSASGANAKEGEAELDGKSGPEGKSEPEEEKEALPEPDPEALKLHQRELDFMGELAPILGRTPRSLKRFVNTYRLIKVRLEPVEYRGFMDGEGMLAPYRCVMLLLAFVTGAPTLSNFIFLALSHPERVRQWNAQRVAGSGSGGTDESEKRDPDGQEPQKLCLNWLMYSLNLEPTTRHSIELESIRTWMRTRVLLGEDAAVFRAMARWASTVARFSFRVEQRVGQWKADAEAEEVLELEEELEFEDEF